MRNCDIENANPQLPTRNDQPPSRAPWELEVGMLGVDDAISATSWKPNAWDARSRACACGTATLKTPTPNSQPATTNLQAERLGSWKLGCWELTTLFQQRLGSRARGTHDPELAHAELRH